MAYQDRWTRGHVTPGDRACGARYEVVRTVASAWSRPITVWDLGANLGYFGLRLADELGAIAVMVDARPVLASVCQENAIPTTIAMTARLSIADLQELAAAEHADLVLALNLLHHFDNWRAAFEAVCRLGETIVIETPGRGDIGSAHYAASQSLLDAIEASGAELLATHLSHVTPGVQRPLYRLIRPKASLASGYVYGARVRAKGAIAPRSHVIVSTATEKTITFADGESRPFVPGLNLWNWLQLGGAYPSRAEIAKAVRASAAGLFSHGDLMPWNVILQGQDVTIIDAGHRRHDDARGLRDTLTWIDDPEAAYVA